MDEQDPPWERAAPTCAYSRCSWSKYLDQERKIISTLFPRLVLLVPPGSGSRATTAERLRVHHPGGVKYTGLLPTSTDTISA